jgi:hypothetical protein
VEVAYKIQTLPTDPKPFLVLQDTGTVHVDLRVSPAGVLSITRNGTVLASTAGPVITVGTFYHLGLKAAIADAGSYEIRLNGSTILTGPADTRNGANGWFNQVRLENMWPDPGNHTFDDLIVSADGFCGDCQVVALFPQDSGFYSDWTMPAQQYTYHGGSGPRGTVVTVAQSASNVFGGGVNPSLLVDGSYTVAAGSSSFGTAVDASSWLRFDFGVPRIVDEAIHYQSMTSSHGTWKWQGSADASVWTDIGGSFILGGNTVNVFLSLNGNVTPYRYYRIVGVSGTMTGGVNQFEFDFRIDNSVNPLTEGWQLVDEPLMNSDYDYVFSATPGQRNSYDFQALPVTGSILGVQHVTTVRKDNTGTRTVKQFARVADADDDGAAITVTDNYLMQRRMLLLNPATGLPWTIAELDAAEFGSVLVS